MNQQMKLRMVETLIDKLNDGNTFDSTSMFILHNLCNEFELDLIDDSGVLMVAARQREEIPTAAKVGNWNTNAAGFVVSPKTLAEAELV